MLYSCFEEGSGHDLDVHSVQLQINNSKHSSPTHVTAQRKKLFAFKTKVVPVHVVKTCVGINVKRTAFFLLALDGSKTDRILTLGTGWK